MTAFARSTGVEVETVPFEGWEPAGRQFDLVISAQAWHWIDPFVGATKAASVLCPSGRVGLFWNIAELEQSIQAAFDEQYRLLGLELDQHSVVLGRGDDSRFQLAADGLRATGSFDEVELREYRWVSRYTTETWLDHLPTHSDHATLPSNQLSALTERIGEVIDARGGAFSVTYRTVLIRAARK